MSVVATPRPAAPLTRTASNGLRLVASPCSGGLATIAIVLPAGTLYEVGDARPGAAHLLARLLTQGTHTFPTAEALAMHLETLGGAYSAGAEHDLTSVVVSVPATELPSALAAAIEIATQPTLAERSVRLERRRFSGQLRGAAAVPAARAGDLADKLLWPDSPEGWTSLELARAVSRLQRSDLESFHAAQFGVSGAALAIATPTPLEQALASVEAATARWPAGAPRSPVIPALGQERAAAAAMAADLAYLVLAAPAVRRGHPDSDALNLLSIVLGGGATSRLFVEVREKRGLCYGIGCRLAGHSLGGTLRIDAGVPPDHLKEAVDAIIEQIQDVAATASDQEVDKARAMLLGHLAMESDRPETWARRYSRDIVQLGRPRTFQEIVAIYQALDAARVRQVAGAYFTPDKLRLSVAGPAVTRRQVRGLVPG